MDAIKLNKENLLRSLPEFIFDGSWIAGGAVRDSLINIKASDVDIFGNSKEKLDLFIEKNLKGCRKVYDTDGMKTFILNGDKVQVIYRLYSTINDCLDSFDYTLCQFGFDGNHIITTPQSIVDLFRKKIVIHKINPSFAVNSLRRIQKYIQKGFTICDGGLKQIVDTIRESSQEDIDSQFEFYPDGTRRIKRFD